MSRVATNKPTSERAEAAFAGKPEHCNGCRSVTKAWRETERELTERGGAYELRLSFPGYKAGEVQVTALPDAIVIAAESSYGREEEKENVHYCELAGRSLFRRISLPEPINTGKVKTELKDGILRITATKATEVSKKATAAA
jgi:HSP20 family molecular chaperone IbpA